MTELIHQDTHDWKHGPRWVVERPFEKLPNLVRFAKHGRTRKMLDRIAHWNGTAWDPCRWVPQYPQVPPTLLALVENYLREKVPDA